MTQTQEQLVSEKTSESLEEYINLGNLCIQEQKWQEAITHYRKAIEINRGLIDVYRQLVIACQNLEEKQLATEYQYQVFKLDPNRVSAEEYYDLGNQLWFYNRPGKAADCYRQAHALKPNFIEAYCQLGKLLVENRNLQKAVNAYRAGIKNNPENSQLYYLLAQALSSQENWQEAIVNYQKSLGLDPNSASTYFGLAEVFKHQNQWEQAIENYQKTLAIDSNYWQAILCLGNIWQTQEKWENATNAYYHTIKINPEAIEAYLNLGSILIQQEHYRSAFNNYSQALQMSQKASNLEQEAISGCRQALTLNSNSQAIHYYQLGKLLRAKSLFDEAIKEYQRAIEIDPDFQSAYIDIQYTQIDSKQLDELISFYRKILKKQHNSPMAWGNLGDALTQQENLEEAINCYQTSCYQIAIESNPKLAEIDWKPKKENPPDFIIIGASKCGTSSLHKYLGNHPQILLPHKKELDFFWQNYNKGIDWYLSHFPSITDRSDFLTGEATPNYIRFPEIARRIHQLASPIKLILLLRNPIDRAVSWHYHKIRTGLTQGTIESAISQEIKKIDRFSEEKIINTAFYNPDNILSSLYIYKIREWMKIIPQEQFLILKSEDLYNDPVRIMKKVFEFLELPEHQLPEYQKINVGFYAPISQELRTTLADYFRPYNQQLEDYLGMEFNWG
jgi:tetratricopeptide (TPR) repeat protein